MPKKSEAKKILKVTLVKSAIGYSMVHKGTIRALGLRKMNQTVTHDDNSTIRGMLAKVSHLVKVEEQVEQ